MESTTEWHSVTEFSQTKPVSSTVMSYYRMLEKPMQPFCIIISLNIKHIPVQHCTVAFLQGILFCIMEH